MPTEEEEEGEEGEEEEEEEEGEEEEEEGLLSNLFRKNRIKVIVCLNGSN